MSDLQSLIERVEKATGPDREIDARLDHMTRRVGIVWGRGDDFGVTPAENVDQWTDEQWAEASAELAQSMPAYTASIDAALSLVERKLPGWFWSVSNAAMKPRANVWEPIPTRPVMGPFSSAATPALAICLALLKAVQAQANNDATEEIRG